MKGNQNIERDGTEIRDIIYGGFGKKSQSYDIHVLYDPLDEEKRVSNEVFFACGNCSGPLVRHTFCRICRNTSSRICVKCNKLKLVEDHQNCLRTVLLEMKKRLSKVD